MNEPEQEDKRYYQARMRPFSLSGLKYEAGHMLAAFLAAVGLAAANYFVTVHFGLLYTHPMAPLYSMAVMVGFGFFIAFWSMSYFPRRVAVYPNRIYLKMLVSEREVKIEDVARVTVLSEAEARKTYFSLLCANLSPGIVGMVRLDRARGRAWVFSPEDAEEFTAAVHRAMSGRPDQSHDQGPATENG